MKINLIKDLNPNQAEAVTYDKGPLLILAGAGCGKTKVLTHKIAHFVINSGIPSNRILGVTFTNKAANEMKERIMKLINRKYEFPYLGTFHSICAKILRNDGRHIGLEPSFTIYDTEDQKDVVKEALKSLNIDPKEINPSAILWAISNAKNDLIDPKQYSELVGDYFTENVSRVYPVYQKLLSETNAVDFDDLIMKTIQLFNENKQIAQKYIDNFDQVLVDEYQDTNKAQYVLIKTLAIQKQNISVVGDEDQSIYGWRGADIQNILSFERDFKDAKIIKLEQNYRSTQIILDAAYSVITKNTERRDKKLWSERRTGPKIRIYEAQNEVDEAVFIVRKIKELQSTKSLKLKNIAVLYRANAQSRSLEEQFLKAKIPYRLIGGQKFYDRKEIKDALAYLRIIYNSSDVLSLQRVINNPPRGIGPKTITDIIEASKLLKIPILDLITNITLYNTYKEQLNEYNQKKHSSSEIFGEIKREEFFDNLNNFRNALIESTKDSKLIQNTSVINFGNFINSIRDQMDSEIKLSDFIKMVLEDSGYYNHINDKSKDGENRIENLKELIGVASRYDSMPFPDSLGKFLEDVSLIEDIQDREAEGKGKDSVTLMTLHAAKGLEFEVVFITGLEEGIFPHSRSLTDRKEMEEERRLAYVGITRAKTDLFLIYAISRNYFGKIQSNIVSRFITDIPEDLINFINTYDAYDYNFTDKSQNDLDDYREYMDIGDLVSHDAFGKGKIVDIDGDVVTVDFENKGKTKLIAQYAKLKKIN